MKLSEIRPCDSCHGKIAPIFYVIEIAMAIFNPRATQQQLGLTQFFGGSLAMAEIMGAQPEVIRTVKDEDPEATTKLFICQECYTMKDLNLAILAENVATT